MTDWLGQSQVIPYLGGLASDGHEIHLISFEKRDARKKLEEKIRQLMIDYKLHWYPLKYTSKPKILSTLFDIIRMQRTAFRLQKKIGFDIVHARSYIPSLVAMRLKHKFGMKYIFDMRGLWVEERIEGKIWNISNPLFKGIYHYFKRKEKKFLQNSDNVVSVSHAAVPFIQNYAGEKIIDVHVIPCGADFELFNYNNVVEDNRAKLMTKLKIEKNDKVLSYLGSIGTWYMLDEMLELFSLAMKEGVLSKFLFITKESEKHLQSRAGLKGIPAERIIVRSADRSEVPLYLSLSFANIFFIRASFSKIASSPVKFAEALGLGIPVIANAGVGDLEKHFSEAEIGILLKSLDQKSMLEAVRKIPELERLSKESIRKAALCSFDLNAGIVAYRKIYKECLGSGPMGK